MTKIRGSAWVFSTALLVGVLAASPPSYAGDKQKVEVEKKGASAALKEAGLTFESARLLSAADRIPALEGLGRTVTSVLKGDLSQEEQAAASALSAQIRYEL